jgi:glycine/D-amino acid oxidase-like deaminating enzyme
MDGERDDRFGRLRSFAIGGVVGASAALAAARRRRQVLQRRRQRAASPPGLAAFEQAPCFQELEESEELEQG